MHRGLDLALPIGTRLLAPLPCVVTGVWTDSDGGLQITMAGKTPAGGWPAPRLWFAQDVATEGSPGYDDSGWRLGFAHLDQYEPGIEPGAILGRGQPFGYSGASGKVTGPHVHVNVYWLSDGALADRKFYVDPAILIPGLKPAVAPVQVGPHAWRVPMIMQAQTQPNVQRAGSVVIQQGDDGIVNMVLGNGAAFTSDVDVGSMSGR